MTLYDTKVIAGFVVRLYTDIRRKNATIEVSKQCDGFDSINGRYYLVDEVSRKD